MGHWSLSWAIVLSACGFRAGVTPGDDTPADASSDVASPWIDAAVDAPPVAPCADPDIIACYPFEGSTNDASANGLDVDAPAEVSFVSDGKPGMALHVGSNSAINVADSSLFDVTAVTIEAWVRPADLPTGTNRYGILDCQSQYGMFIHAAGAVHCTAGGALSTSDGVITPNAWTHTACTYDGSTRKIYINGTLVAMGTGVAIGSGSSGISIASDNPPGSGEQLNGDIDEVRLYKVARSATQICQDAGQLTCQ